MDTLNEQYGESNWRIVHWHQHKQLMKLDTPYYTQVVYTPVVSVGLEHDLFTIPYMNPLIDKSAVSCTIMADILYRKFALGLPFYRQALDYRMQGIALTRQTIINWAGALVPEICEEVYEFMTQLLVGYRYTQCDETYIQVNKDGYGPGHKSFLLVHASSELTDCPPIIIFCYEETRGRTICVIFSGSSLAISPVTPIFLTGYWKRKAAGSSLQPAASCIAGGILRKRFLYRMSLP